MIERAVAVKHNPDVRIRFDEDSRWLFPHVRALFYEINQNIPSFCGMTVYGSRVKWEGTSTSDKDAYLTIAGLFHLSLGSGIGKLRRVVFDTLITYPNQQTSERYWHMLMMKLSNTERLEGTFFREVAYAHYPQSIQEGMCYFVL